MRRTHFQRRLQWRLPFLTAALVGGLSLLISLVQPSTPAILQAILLSAASGALVYFLLRQPLKQLAQVNEFVPSLAAMHGKQLEIAAASAEISELLAALNTSSQRLHAQDEAINAAFTELQEQQYAFDQHAIVSMIDCNGVMQYANDRLCAFSGFKRNDLLGRPFTMLSAEPDPIAYNQMLWEKMQQGEVWHGEMSIKKSSGKTGWVDASLVPIRATNGATQHYICIQTDVTERKDHEDALAANQRALELLAVNMEQLIKERTAELEKTNGDLAQANQAKSEFISIVSHELRTPLTSIKSFAAILNDEVDDPDAKRCLRIINDEADRLNRLIDDILDLQKIDAGRMVWRDEKVNLVDIARAAVESFSGAYQAKQIALELHVAEQNLLAKVDSDKIRQILANLLSNALKFTPAGTVALRLTRIWDSRSQLPYLQIAVADNGPGLAASQLSRIFEQFYQVENDQSRKIQGTGLGLTICKQIVDHYRGRIWAESEIGKGATISFILPDASNASKKLGEILVDLGYLTDAQIDQALQHQRLVDAQQANTPAPEHTS